MSAGLLIGVMTTTKDGTVTVAVDGGGLAAHLNWVDALAAVRALIQAAGTASAIAGVSREDFVTAMLTELGEVAS